MPEKLSDIERTIYRLKNREISLHDFAEWVYSERSLEALLSPEDYLNLISLDYTARNDLYEAEKILFKNVDEGKFYELNLRRVLNGIVEKRDEAEKDIEYCYELYCAGYDFLDTLGLGYGLCITVPPSAYGKEEWQQLSVADQRTIVENMYPAVAKEATRVINWLDTGKIVFTGHDGSYQGIQYEDHRAPEEKESSTVPEAVVRKKQWWKVW